MSIELARDKHSVRLQVTSYNSATQDETETGEGSFVLDGTSAADTSAAFVANRVVEITATTAMIWIKIGSDPTAVDEEGQPIPQNTWKTIAVDIGDKISVIGGKAAIVPLGK